MVGKATSGWESDVRAMMKISLRNEIVEYYLPLVRLRAGSMCRHNRDMYHDMYQCGVIGLIHAVETYDPNNKIRSSFNSYAEDKIQWAIQDGLRKMWDVGRTYQKGIREGRYQRPIMVEEKELNKYVASCQDVQETIYDQEVQDIIQASLRRLNEQEHNVVFLYFFQRMKMKQIGKELHVNESRVSQIMTASKKKLRKVLCEAT